MALATETSGVGRRLVLAHGFTQNRRCWGPLLPDLARDHEVVAVDLPGHGATPSAHDEADLSAAGALLADAGGPAVYVGYSMGGRVALHTVFARPSVVQGLVLIGATAGLDGAADRRDRRTADDALAAELVEAGLDAFLDRWLAGPLFAGLSAAAAARPARLTNRVDGLAASLRNCGTGTQEPLWDKLQRIEAPVLVLVGRDDAKFTTIGARLVDALPTATMQTLPGTHAIHLEQPHATASSIRSFVADL